MALSIHALPAGVLRNFPSAALTYQRGFGQVQDCPQIMFAILGGPSPVLVDTGTPDPAFVREYHGYDFERDEQEHPLATLAGLGVRPEDVEVVIHTHLHWDHAYNTHLFPKSTRLICQKKELESLDDPDEPSNKIGYVKEYIKLFKYELVDGDEELFPGVSVVYTPGHTIGCQSVIVDTGEGPVIIAGDLIPLQCSWYSDPPKGNGLCYNELSKENMHTSMEKLRKISTKILTGHDNGVFGPGMGMK